MQRNLLIILSFFLSFTLFSQNLDCENFREGEFIIQSNNPVPLEYKVTRTGMNQIEEIIKIPQEIIDSGFLVQPGYGIINWIDDCTYILMYDPSIRPLTETEKMVNESGGVTVNIVNIESTCCNFKSVSSINGEEYVIEGVMCKL
ncbi:hypothetical protein [Altibacter lentus]|uniref:hypothetical protein n=1 Tax=Altibacter lentus TaxID=1223410 RepID=UPI00055003A8|nr:hypothetical protein [Altibacter lentus]